MANLKIKTFNNFHDVQNVVEDGRKVTTEIQLEGSPVKAVAAKNHPKVCDKSPKMVAKNLARMISTKTADIGLLRRFLLSLSDDLPDLVSKLLTDSEVSQVRLTLFLYTIAKMLPLAALRSYQTNRQTYSHCDIDIFDDRKSPLQELIFLLCFSKGS